MHFKFIWKSELVCIFIGTISIDPSFSTPYGGKAVTITGPCYTEDDDIYVKFNQETTQCEAVRVIPETDSADESILYGARCVVPFTLVFGRIIVKMSLDGGATFPFRGRMNLGK